MIPYLFILCAFLMLADTGFFVLFVERRDWKWVGASVCVAVILVLIISMLDGYAR